MPGRTDVLLSLVCMAVLAYSKLVMGRAILDGHEDTAVEQRMAADVDSYLSGGVAKRPGSSATLELFEYCSLHSYSRRCRQVIDEFRKSHRVMGVNAI